MLFQAYKTKFQIDHTDIFKNQKKCTGQFGESSDQGTFIRKILCKYYVSDKDERRWSKEKILCTFFCPVYNMRFRKPILIRTAENPGIEALKYIQKWIDKIRQNSLESSFVKNIKLPSQQLYEIRSVLKDIDEVLKNGK